MKFYTEPIKKSPRIEKLVDALYEKESPFIILDDPFIALDDSKLERAKNTLKALGKSRQILYFTCSKAREIV